MDKIFNLMIFSVLLILSPTCFSTELYICEITEVINARFKHGKWVKADVLSGKEKYAVLVIGKTAILRQLLPENDKSEPIKSSCNLVGGTSGFVCEEFLKLVPNAERIKINFYPNMHEITISSNYTLREMNAYDKDYRSRNKYFDDITLSFSESYGKCKRDRDK